jgi:hypothetical protein
VVVASYRDELAKAVATWKDEGEEAGAEAFAEVKAKFPAFDREAFVATLLPGFSFCRDIPDLVLLEGESVPKPVPAPITPPASNAGSPPSLFPVPPVTGAFKQPPAIQSAADLAETNKTTRFSQLFTVPR